MIEVEIEDEAWSADLPGIEPLVDAAATAALSSAHPGEGRDPSDNRLEAQVANPTKPSLGPGLRRDERMEGWTLTVLLTSDAEIAELNARFRGKPVPTNVLSFPAAPGVYPWAGLGPDPGAAPHLGDIALAHGVCAREAAAQGKTLADHLQHLVVHGVLHLLGSDHADDAEAEEMEATEREVLATLGVADPYREPVASAHDDHG